MPLLKIYLQQSHLPARTLQAMMQEMQRNPELMQQMMAGMGGGGGGALGGMQNMLAQNPEMLAQMMQVGAIVQLNNSFNLKALFH